MAFISLNGISLRGPIGVHEEERILGNEFTVDLKIKTNIEKAARNDDLEYTVDYELLYQLVAKILSEPANLIEAVAVKIAKKVLKQFKRIEEVEVVLRKLNPPISGKCENATIEFKLKR